MNAPFYFVFPSYEEAAEALPSFESAAAKALRAEAERARIREQESFERCDTDGFLSQWASSITAQEKEREATLANHAGLVIEAALLDTNTGELLTACIKIRKNPFSYGTETIWLFKRPGADRREYVTDYKRESNFAKKALRKVWVIAPGKMLARSPGNFLEEPRGLGGCASYSGKHAYPDYSASGLPL